MTTEINKQMRQGFEPSSEDVKNGRYVWKAGLWFADMRHPKNKEGDDQ